MRLRFAAILVTTTLLAGSQAAIFGEFLVQQSGSDVELTCLASTPKELFIAGGNLVGSGEGSFLPLRYDGGTGYGGLRLGAGTVGRDVTYVGSLGFLSASNSVTGQGFLAMTHTSNGHSSAHTISDPSGNVAAIPDSLVATQDNNDLKLWALFEVRPPSGPRKLLVVLVPSYNWSGIVTQSYTLGAGESVLDCAPRPNGGFVILTGTTASASTQVINPDLTRQGPFLVGPASQVAFDPAGLGAVFTAGASGSNAYFTRGPLTGPFIDSRATPLPFSNLGFEFTCAATRVNGSIWWGGNITNLSGNKDAFICATTNDATLGFFGAKLTANSGADESTHSIAIDPFERGIWTADGQVAIFDATNGDTIKAYPPTPDLNVQYREAVNAPSISGGIEGIGFGAVGFNSTTNKSYLVFVGREEEPFEAYVSTPICVGGINPKLIVRLFQIARSSVHLPLASSSPFVTVPGEAVVTTGWRSTGVRITTVPVSSQQNVQISVGSDVVVTASLTLMPPTPRFFTPASLSVNGGNSAVSRLTLTGKTPAGGISVNFGVSGSEISVSPTLFVAGGLYSRSFLIRTQTVAASVTRFVTASYGGVSSTTNVTVNP